jgi:hypothetical protein
VLYCRVVNAQARCSLGWKRPTRACCPIHALASVASTARTTKNTRSKQIRQRQKVEIQFDAILDVISITDHCNPTIRYTLYASQQHQEMSSLASSRRLVGTASSRAINVNQIFTLTPSTFKHRSTQCLHFATSWRTKILLVVHKIFGENAAQTSDPRHRESNFFTVKTESEAAFTRTSEVSLAVHSKVTQKATAT